MIRIGQAGIPLSCKGRTNKDGIIYTHSILDLNAIEIQFVRGLYVMPDEEAENIRNYTRENDIETHVHAQYYINLAGNSEEVEMSFEKIMRAAQMADKIKVSGDISVKQQGDQWVQHVDGEVSVKIFGVGKMAEKFLVEKIQNSSAVENRLRNEFVHSIEDKA